MIYRAVTIDDLPLLKELHERFYPEWEFPDFTQLLNGFIICDDNNEIILAGGVELIAESVLVTNKKQSRIKIGRALIEAQNISIYTCNRFGIRELLAFVNDENYERHLIKHGFSPQSKALSLRIPIS